MRSEKSVGKRIFLYLVVLLTLASCGDSSQRPGGESAIGGAPYTTAKEEGSISKRDKAARYVPGEILVKFKEGTAAHTVHGLHQALRVTKIKEVRNIGVQHIRLPKSMRVEEALEYYRKDPNVEYAEPNFIIKKAVLPNDPDFPNLWGLNNTGQTGGTIDADIDAPEAWDVTTGSGDVVIAVIDSGVAYNHPDLAGNIWINTNEVVNGLDDDGNGYVDDIYGWDFIDNDGYPFDYDSHGTHVAGTIAAEGNNGTGMTGVMWSAKIMSLRFLGVSGWGNTADAAAAIIYAADHGARIINASWGGRGYSRTLYDAIHYARSKNVLFVAAAGNETKNNDAAPFYPASYNLPNIISVAASNHDDALASFSNYGSRSVHLAAPGVGIYSTVPVFTYDPPTTVYSENFDGGSGDLPLLGWSRGGTNSTWAVTSGTGVGGTNSLEDSPGGNYLPYTNSWAGYMAPFASVKNNRYTISFKWKGTIDTITSDYLNINYSSDGITWDWVDWIDGNTDGIFKDYSTTEITAAADLLDSFYFGFGLESDGSGNYDGAYIDEVVLTRESLSIRSYSYDSYQGTSMAAPHVSGVSGLVLSLNPSLSYSQVKEIILQSVDKKPSFSGKTLTGGRLNAFVSLKNAVAPDAPSSLVATVVSISQVDLTWKDNSTNETGFKIERRTDASRTYSQISTVSANVSEFSDTGVSGSTTYFYRVRAYNIAGDSSYSNEVSVTTPSPPSPPTVAPSGGGGGGGGCFIATAAYGTPFAPEVQILRRFRDRYLLTHPLGSASVRVYYEISPPIANYIKEHEWLRTAVRGGLKLLLNGVNHPGLSLLFAIFALAATSSAWRMSVRKKKMQGNGLRGFTLIELMVVIFILSLLVAIVGPRIIGRTDDARIAEAKVQIRNFETALKLFKIDNGFYPSTEQGLEALIEKPSAGRIPNNYREGGYLEQRKIPLDPWGKSYIYVSPGIYGDFDIISYGADGREGGEGADADIRNWDM